MSTLPDPPERQVHRCMVLGDRTACPITPFVPGERIDVELAPGPYARYLMHVGQDRDSAIAAAR